MNLLQQINIRQLPQVSLSKLYKEHYLNRRNDNQRPDDINKAHEDGIQVHSPFCKRSHNPHGPCDCPYHRMKRYKSVTKNNKGLTNTVVKQEIKNYKTKIGDTMKDNMESKSKFVLQLRNLAKKSIIKISDIRNESTLGTEKQRRKPQFDDYNYLFQEILKHRMNPIPDETKAKNLIKFINMTVQVVPSYIKRVRNHIINYLLLVVRKIGFGKILEAEPGDTNIQESVCRILNCEVQAARQFIRGIQKSAKEMNSFILDRAKIKFKKEQIHIINSEEKLIGQKKQNQAPLLDVIKGSKVKYSNKQNILMNRSRRIQSRKTSGNQNMMKSKRIINTSEHQQYLVQNMSNSPIDTSKIILINNSDQQFDPNYIRRINKKSSTKLTEVSKRLSIELNQNKLDTVIKIITLNNEDKDKLAMDCTIQKKQQSQKYICQQKLSHQLMKSAEQNNNQNANSNQTKKIDQSQECSNKQKQSSQKKMKKIKSIKVKNSDKNNKLKSTFSEIKFSKLLTQENFERVKKILEGNQEDKKKMDLLFEVIEGMCDGNPNFLSLFIESFEKAMTMEQIRILYSKAKQSEVKKMIEKLVMQVDDAIEQMQNMTLLNWNQEQVEQISVNFPEFDRTIDIEMIHMKKSLLDEFNKFIVLQNRPVEKKDEDMINISQRDIGSMYIQEIRVLPRLSANNPYEMTTKKRKSILKQVQIQQQSRINEQKHREVLRFMKKKYPCSFNRVKIDIHEILQKQIR